MGLYSGEGGGGGKEGGGYIRQGAYIREEKHFNLQSVKLIFLSFFPYKAYTGGNIGMLIGLHMAAYIRECLLYGRGGVLRDFTVFSNNSNLKFYDNNHHRKV